jgi:hypothetical protein
MFTLLTGLLSPLIGALIRLAPEILKFFDKKLERAHELLMQDKALEFEKLRGAQRMAELSSEMQNTQLEAIGKAATAQLRKTGIRWVDAVNALVRPTITYFFVGLYGAVKICAIVSAMQSGNGLIVALPTVWHVDHDMPILGSIIGFWFVSRVYDKRGA